MSYITIKIFEENGSVETQYNASGTITDQKELLKKAIEKNEQIDNLLFSIVLEAYKNIPVNYETIKPNTND